MMPSARFHPAGSSLTIRATPGPSRLARRCSSTRAWKSSSFRSWSRATLYNAINQSLAIVGAENSTVHSVAVSTFACPSDPMSGSPRSLNPGALTRFGVPDPSWMVFTSYAGMIGSLPVDAFPSPRNAASWSRACSAQSNGVFNDLSPIRLASVTDGLSNTIFMAEKSTTILQELNVVNPAIFAQARLVHHG